MLALRRLVALDSRFDDNTDWSDFIELIDRTIAASRRARLRAPAPDDASFIDALDTNLLRIAGSPDSPVVTDIHTDPVSDRVVYEAIAPPHIVTLKADDVNSPLGARLHHLEFVAARVPRWTDARWREFTGEENRAQWNALSIAPWSSHAMGVQ
jgi:hypothetical protein